MNQLEVQIMGQSYLLGCPDGGEARLLDAVERVDTAMCKIREAGKVRARDRIAVLAALNLAFDLADQSTHRSGQASLGTTDIAQSDPRLSALLARIDDVLTRDQQLI
jgi:cell division protein ZapA